MLSVIAMSDVAPTKCLHLLRL